MININKPLTFTVPLSYKAHSLANQSRLGIANPLKAKQVYLNSLAVYSVNYYLHCMGFETDWENSDSQNTVLIKLMDVAALSLPNLGKLECRPVLPNAEFLDIPPEVSEDRIGYVAVQLNQSLKEATILGFTRSYAERVSLKELADLSRFLEYLSLLEPQPQSILSPVLVNLGQWLEGMVETGWQSIEQLLSSEQLHFRLAFRDKISVTKGQKFDLGMQLDGDSLGLILELNSEEKSEVNITTELHPLNHKFLPEGVHLKIEDEFGEGLSAIAREEDNWIQLKFSAVVGEKFKITVSLKDAQITRDFVV